MLKQNFLLGLCAAAVGVVIPLGLSYLLLYLGFGYGILDQFPRIFWLDFSPHGYSTRDLHWLCPQRLWAQPLSSSGAQAKTHTFRGPGSVSS